MTVAAAAAAASPTVEEEGRLVRAGRRKIFIRITSVVSLRDHEELESRGVCAELACRTVQVQVCSVCLVYRRNTSGPTELVTPPSNSLRSNVTCTSNESRCGSNEMRVII